MKGYEVGREVGELRVRIEALEKQLLNCGCNQGRSDVVHASAAETEGLLASEKFATVDRYVRWNFGDTALTINGATVVEITRYRMVLVGSIIGGQKEAYLLIGGLAREVSGRNWNLCINGSAKRGTTYVATAFGQAIIPANVAAQPFAAWGFPIDQTAANVMYDGIGAGLTNFGPRLDARGSSSSIPLGCQ